MSASGLLIDARIPDTLVSNTPQMPVRFRSFVAIVPDRLAHSIEPVVTTGSRGNVMKTSQITLSRGTLAEFSGVNGETIRYYEIKGLRPNGDSVSYYN